MIILYINLSTVTISFLLLSEIFYHILLKSIKNKTDLQKGKKSIANFRICDIIDKYLMIYFRRKVYIMQTLFLVLHLIVSVILIFVVMAQEGKDPGMRGIQGASSDMGDSFFKKNGGTTKEAMFIKLTTTIAILFLITTTVLVILGA